jgi:hypothetical protein
MFGRRPRPVVPVVARAALLGALLGAAPAAPAQAPARGPAPGPASGPSRAVRRDVPITSTIRRALAAGTRDSTGRPTARYWQLRTDYTIEARLDTATSQLVGRERVVIHNASPDTLRQIVLRLDPNLFRPETPKAAPWVPAEATEGMVVTRMAVGGRPVRLEVPNDAPAGQGARSLAAAAAAAGAAAEPTATGLRTTVARVQLAAPVPPRAAATLDVEWRHKLPGGPGGRGHRMTQRWADTLYQPTQWYPRVAVYDDLRGWDTELYLGPSEFYNNFGRFDVRLDVPAGWLVSGTGLLRNPEAVLTPQARARLARVLDADSVTTVVGADERGPGRATAAGANGRLVWHFAADSVNDFAWATARSFVWRATRATIPGEGGRAPRRVPIHMLHLPGRAELFAEAGPVTRHALEFYSRLWFPYAFPQLTLQDGPSAGMEYPMVINSNQGAADHETGHQWWPMVVSNNETWYGWMDEGFNQYMNVLSDADAEGKPADLDGLGQSYGRTAGSEAEPPMMGNANYAGPQFYGFTTYTKTPLMLSMLGGVVGDSAVQRAHREWGRAWRFRHPSPWDYMFFMDRALGRDLGWFWNGWLFTTASVDGSVAAVEARGGRTVVTVRQDGDMPSPVVLEVKLAASGAPVRPMANAVMTDATTAVVTYPVDVWFGGARTFAAALDFGGRAVERVTLDPRRRFPDRDPSDNVWPRAAAAASPSAGR